MSSMQSLRLFAAGLVIFSCAAVKAQPSQACQILIPPTPTGVTERSGDSTVAGEYQRMTAGTHLQGKLAFDKWAPVTWNPDGRTGNLPGYRSYVVVNNPDPVSPCSVTLTFYNSDGSFASMVNRTIQARGMTSWPAFSLSTTFGSVHVTSTGSNPVPFVGTTVHHTYFLPNPLGSGNLSDRNAFQSNGATTHQQLQADQGHTSLNFGPIPVNSNSATPLVNGNTGYFFIVNPNAVPVPVSLRIERGVGAPIVRNFTIPANGTYFDTAIRALTDLFYQSGISINEMWNVRVTSAASIIGEGALVDTFGANGLSNSLGQRFRIASMMMAGTPACQVVCPEFTSSPNIATLDTYIGISNPTSQNSGAISVDYFDRDGVLIASDGIASLAQWGSALIGPGLPASPNYPAGVFDGRVSIRAATESLIGWSVRASELPGPLGFTYWQKSYGESLHGCTGSEPGNGFTSVRNGVPAAGTYNTKAISLAFVEEDLSPRRQGYANAVNDSVSNIGQNLYRFYDRSGALDRTNYAAYGASQSWAGLVFGSSSFTYQDGPNALIVPNGGFLNTLSGVFDCSAGSVKGIATFGGKIKNMQIVQEGNPGGYPGPGDTVPGQTP